MIRSTLRSCAGTLVAIGLPGLLLVLSCSPVLGQDAESDESESEWRALFNGEDLSGWRELNGDHRWEARNGQIVGTSVPGTPNGFLVTEKTFGDFVLELEVKADVLMNNSGIQFRSLSTEDYREGRVHGYQAEIDTKPQRWSGSIYDEARRGWLFVMDLNPRAKPAFRNGEWNHYRIEAIGPVLRTWVNGVPAAHLVDDETSRGFVGLQMHANQDYDPEGPHRIRFRNIRVKTEDLRPAPPTEVPIVNLIPNHLSARERVRGYSRLFDGRSLEGWTTAAAESAASGDAPSAVGWTLADGAIRAPAASGERSPGALITEQRFAAFEVVFAFRVSEQGVTCGIGYGPAAESSGTEAASTYCRMASKKLADGWNRGRIRAHPGGRTEYVLNGHPILEYQREEPRRRGPIRIVPRSAPVDYRSIKIRVLR